MGLFSRRPSQLPWLGAPAYGEISTVAILGLKASGRSFKAFFDTELPYLTEEIDMDATVEAGKGISALAAEVLGVDDLQFAVEIGSLAGPGFGLGQVDAMLGTPVGKIDARMAGASGMVENQFGDELLPKIGMRQWAFHAGITAGKCGDVDAVRAHLRSTALTYRVAVEEAGLA
jgi:hypothetical protein